MKKQKNTCDSLVESFADMGADTLGVYSCDGEYGTVTVVPLNSKTGVSWAMSLITSVEEAVQSKYPKSFRSEEDYNNFIKFAGNTPMQKEQGGKISSISPVNRALEGRLKQMEITAELLEREDKETYPKNGESIYIPHLPSDDKEQNNG